MQADLFLDLISDIQSGCTSQYRLRSIVIVIVIVIGCHGVAIDRHILLLTVQTDIHPQINGCHRTMVDPTNHINYSPD